jgi:hypothetical protein
MANEISRVNRKIKAAMKRFIDKEDDTAFRSIITLAKKREDLLKSRPFKPKNKDSDEN